ncbi:ISxac3 transposase [Blastopirellula marina DSM 3645]|uniref:ISxac3 transposase n=1 Tax=Blastopirellula marina DSM 3645 TaxID=314230 RepID=A3ZLI5_9BACT|nr:ISxac3 transposase [Blastopirellula marina DSM 3645]
MFSGRAPQNFYSTPLGDNLRHNARTHGTAAFANREANAVIHRDRLVQFDFNANIVAWHAHFGADQVGGSGHVSRAEVKLRTIAGEERRVTAPFFLRQAVNFRFKLGVRGDRTRLGEHLAARNIFTLDAAEQAADVVARITLLQDLVEHFDTGDRGLGRGIVQTDDQHFFADLHHAALNTSGGDRSTTFDREHVFDRHQERLVSFASRLRNVSIQRFHQLSDALAGFRIGRIVVGRQRGAADNRAIVARKFVLAEQFTNFQLNQVQQLFIVDQVALVQEDANVRHANLTSQQNVLLRLRHRTVSSRHNQNRSVHLGGAGDHVLHEVRVARAVNVGVVTVRGFIFDVRDRNGHRLGRVANRTALGDFGIRFVLRQTLGRLNGEDSAGRGGFAMVNVADGADIDVRLSSLKYVLGHVLCLS